MAIAPIRSRCVAWRSGKVQPACSQLEYLAPEPLSTGCSVERRPTDHRRVRRPRLRLPKCKGGCGSSKPAQHTAERRRGRGAQALRPGLSLPASWRIDPSRKPTSAPEEVYLPCTRRPRPRWLLRVGLSMPCCLADRPECEKVTLGAAAPRLDGERADPPAFASYRSARARRRVLANWCCRDRCRCPRPEQCSSGDLEVKGSLQPTRGGGRVHLNANVIKRLESATRHTRYRYR